MNIQIDLRKIVAKSNLSQAIKVAAGTYKDLSFTVLLDKDDAHTFKDSDKIKIVYSNNDFIKYDAYLTALYKGSDEDGYLIFKILKTRKGEKSIVLGDLGTYNISLSDKFNILENSDIFKKTSTFALLATPIYSDDNLDKFKKNYQGYANFLGVLAPQKINEVKPDFILTTTLLSNMFIDSLNYTIDFINSKKEVKKEGFFSKLGNFNSTAPKEERINYFLEDFTLFLSKEKFIVQMNDDETYLYYFTLIDKVYNLLKK